MADRLITDRIHIINVEISTVPSSLSRKVGLENNNNPEIQRYNDA
jgi:hypothetical protein